MVPLDSSRAWLLLSVIGGRLPVTGEVLECVRDAELDGVESALDTAVSAELAPSEESVALVTVVMDRVLVDVHHHTSQVDFATGI